MENVLKRTPMVAHTRGQAGADRGNDDPRAPPCPQLREFKIGVRTSSWHRRTEHYEEEVGMYLSELKQLCPEITH